MNITIAVNPPGAGYIKISTIVPENLPWTGVYFDGVPVTLTAIPNPGYTFVNWDDNIFIDDETAISFTGDFTDNTTATANFTGAAVSNAIVVSEINFNSDSTKNSGDWIELYNTTGSDISLSNYIFSNKEFYNKDFYGDPSASGSWFPGCVLGSPGTAFANCGENPIIDEINYKSSALEDAGDWFELDNWGAVDFDLNGWSVKDENGNQFIFPSGTIIPAVDILRYIRM
ncbi:MAG: lamin tail domain-containing protein [Bacteroidetes bacterium]|nr:lamin tail domain-containing protein [Bacteroidota bacterium]